MIKKLLFFALMSPHFLVKSAACALPEQEPNQGWGSRFLKAVRASDEQAYNMLLRSPQVRSNSILSISNKPGQKCPHRYTVHAPLLGLAALYNRPITCKYLLEQGAPASVSIGVRDCTTHKYTERSIMDIAKKATHQAVGDVFVSFLISSPTPPLGETPESMQEDDLLSFLNTNK